MRGWSGYGRRCTVAGALGAVAGLASANPTVRAQPEEGAVVRVLVDRDLKSKAVTLTAIDSRTISYVDAGGNIKQDPARSYLAMLPGPGGEPGAAESANAGKAARAGAPTPLTGLRAIRAGAGPAPGEEMTWFGNRLISPLQTSGARPWIDLTDGQRLAGRPVTVPHVEGEKSADVVVWEHPSLGWLQIPLDNVARVRVQGLGARGGGDVAGLRATPGSGDVVVLANGDRLEGFVSAVGGTVTVEAGAGAETGRGTELPLSRVAEIDFSNPHKDPVSPLVWLGDGNVIAVSVIQTPREGQVRLRAALPKSTAAPAPRGGTAAATMGPGEEHLFALSEVRAVLLEPAALKPLAALVPVEQKPIGERRWMEPMEVGDAGSAPLGAADVRLPGPMRVEWELPEGAARLAMTAELPASMRTWGDFILIVSERAAGQPERELLRERMNGERARVEMNTALGGGAAVSGSRRLIVTLDPGAYGPIQDRVVLKGALIGLRGAGKQN